MPRRFIKIFKGMNISRVTPFGLYNSFNVFTGSVGLSVVMMSEVPPPQCLLLLPLTICMGGAAGLFYMPFIHLSFLLGR